MLTKFYTYLQNLMDAPMEKELFDTTQRYFRILGISLKQTTRKYPLIVRNVRTFCVFGSGTIASIFYTVISAKTFEEYIAAFYVLSSMLICFSIYFLVVWRMDEFKQFFIDVIQNMHERLEDSESKKLYEQMGRLIELSSEAVTFVFAFGMTPTFMMPKFMLSIYSYFTTDLGNDALEMPFPMYVPFDWKNPFGYLTVFVIQTVILWHNLCFTSCLVTFGFGIFLFALTTTKDVKYSLHRLNKMAKHKRYKHNARNRLSKFVEHFPKLKHLIKGFSDIYQPIIVILFSWCLITMCGALLMFQIEMNANNLVLIVLSIVQIVWSAGLAFIPCELGERVTISFAEICDVIEELDWYAYPIGMQKVLPLIMINAQESVTLECFAEISCTRGVFKSITNSAFSYFMMLRHLDV